MKHTPTKPGYVIPAALCDEVTERNPKDGYNNIEIQEIRWLKVIKTLFTRKTYRSISPQEAKQRLDSGDPVLLLDVRTHEEYDALHIPGSKSIPLNELGAKIAKVAPDKDAEILVYCLSGGRADSACGQLSALGYSNVSNMGGIRFWKYETESGQ